MGGFDSAVLVVVGLGAVMGLARGFVQETLSLLAWVAGLFAIRFAHPAATAWLRGIVGTQTGAAVIAFALLLVVPYFAVRLLARRAGAASRNSVLGPIDRVLGLGFGALKAMIVVVLAFSVVALGYDTVWGAGGRPGWMTGARAYPFVNSASDGLVALLAQRRQAARVADSATPDAGTPEPGRRHARAPHRSR